MSPVRDHKILTTARRLLVELRFQGGQLTEKRADLHIHSTHSDGTLPPDEIVRLAKESGLAKSDMAARFYLASRGVPDYLMTLVRGAVAETIRQGNEQITLADLARVYESKLAQQRVLAEQANPFVGKLDTGALDRVQAADQSRAAGVGLSPKASRARKRPRVAADYLGGR